MIISNTIILALVNSDDFSTEMQNAHFDVLFVNTYDYCGVGIAHHFNVRAWIWLNTGALKESVADAVGASSPRSYVPSKICLNITIN